MATKLVLKDGALHHALSVLSSTCIAVGTSSVIAEPGKFNPIVITPAYDAVADVYVDGDHVVSGAKLSAGVDSSLGAYGFSFSEEAKQFVMTIVLKKTEKRKYVQRASSVGSNRFVGPSDFSRPLSEEPKVIAGPEACFRITFLRIQTTGNTIVGTDK